MFLGVLFRFIKKFEVVLKNKIKYICLYFYNIKFDKNRLKIFKI